MEKFFVIRVILFFGFGIAIFSKIEHHFSYLKEIYPEKFKNATSLWDATSKFIFIDLGAFYQMIIPIFYKRYRELEIGDVNIQKLTEKIIRECYLTWLFLLLFILFSII
jgi:hypothetical protein